MSPGVGWGRKFPWLRCDHGTEDSGEAMTISAGATGAGIIGIEAGATGLEFSSGERVDFDPAGAPADLLQRIADGVPYVRVVDGTSEVIESVGLYASMVAEAIRGRGVAEPVALAVPGWWPPQVVAELANALAGLGVYADLVNDAEAAVAGYQASIEPLPDTVAVVSLRSRLTSLVVVRDCATRPRAVPSPRLVSSEGGEHLDAAVLQHLVRGLTDLGDEIDVTSSETLRAAREALEQCRNLRETLSRSAMASVQPRLPGAERKLLLVRSELDELADPWLEAILRMLRTAIEQSDEEIGAVLLTGGLAVMPVISQRLSADLGLAVHVPDDLRLTAARGAISLHPGPRRRPSGLRSWWHKLRPPHSAHGAEAPPGSGIPTRASALVQR